MKPQTASKVSENKTESAPAPPKASANASAAEKVRTSDSAPKDSESSSKSIKLSLEDFVVERTLGTGSFGRVHLVKSKLKDSKHPYYALKVLKKSEIVRMKQVEHTINEKNILDMLDHPFLISMMGTFQDYANIYIAMEFVSGGELFSYLRRCGVCVLILTFHSEIPEQCCPILRSRSIYGI